MPLVDDLTIFDQYNAYLGAGNMLRFWRPNGHLPVTVRSYSSITEVRHTCRIICAIFAITCAFFGDVLMSFVASFAIQCFHLGDSS